MGMSQTRAKIRELAWDVAEQILKHNHFATLEETGEVLVYREGVYTSGGEAYVKHLIQQNILPTEISIGLVNEVIGHIQRSTFVRTKIFLEDTERLVLQNGILDTATMKLEPHTPDFYALNKLPVSFVPDQGCPVFQRFLSEVIYADDIPVIQEWFGYCLHRGYPAQVAMLFVGEGNNGKSTLISVLKSLLGFENVSSVGLQELETNRFAKADLFGKLANLYADLSDSALKGVGTFKMLTGGDPIRGEKKFQNSFPFVNHAKLTFSCNVVPEVYEDTTAFFRRWIIIQFPNSFDGTKADRGLLRKLTTPDELSGVLNWALQGLERLRNNGWTFSNSRSTEDVRLDYIRRSSPMKAFIMDATALNPTGVVSKQCLFQAFVKYCQKMKLPVVTSDTFFKNLPLYFGKSPLQPAKEDIDGDGKREHCFRGIELRPENEWGKPAPDDDVVELKIGKTLDTLDTLDKKGGRESGSVQPVQPVQGFSYFNKNNLENAADGNSSDQSKPAAIAQSGRLTTICWFCKKEKECGWYKLNDGQPHTVCDDCWRSKV